jgi:PhoPQ-activated pathogenicity-related protein
MKSLYVVLLTVALALATPLDDYVNKPDSNYAWVDTGKRTGGKGWTGYILNMTSQAWLTSADWHFADGSSPLWWHYMLVVVPDKVLYPDTGFIWITGGQNSVGDLPTNDTEDAFVTSALAVNAGCVGAALFQVPNQPIYFNDEMPRPSRRTEDAMIAWTWAHFMDHPDQPEWLARLPMTKAVVRAMDTLTAFRKPVASITRFAVAGASKRGWTTWTTAAVDKRVFAAIPLVMDELNFVKNVHHHFRAYGGWSFALNDYYSLNFTLRLDNAVTQQMMDIIDPIAYKDRLTMPKMIVNAGGDEFFLPDDQRFWWDEMPNEKNLLMVPNAEHSLATGIVEIIPAVQAFVQGVLQGVPRPVFDWVHDDDAGTITVTQSSSLPKPLNVTMWYAYSFPGTGRRDFRLVAGYPKPGIQPVLWLSKKVNEDPAGYKWVARAPQPPKGQWTAYFVDMRYTGPKSWQYPLHYHSTTSVGVIPNTFPFPECHGDDCKGHLV